MEQKQRRRKQDDRYLKKLSGKERRIQESIRSKVINETLDYLYAAKS